jgi:GT2 family glycosyltransferase
MDIGSNQAVAVIIPTFNRKGLLEKCILSFQKQTYKNFHLIVVNDGSKDGTDKLLKKFEWIKVLHGNGDLWWTGSVNKGIKYALDNISNLEYLILINDDTEVYPDYLEKLIADANNNPKSLIGCVAVDIANPEIIVWGGIIERPFRSTMIINKGKNINDLNKRIEDRTTKLIGRGIIIPVSVFNEIGLYDEKHFKQCGDPELPGRAKLSGYKLLVSNTATVKFYTDKSGQINTRKDKKGYRLRDFKDKFFSVKSNSNLKYVFYYRWNTSKNIIVFIYSITSDIIIRVFHGFLKNVRSL